MNVISPTYKEFINRTPLGIRFDFRHVSVRMGTLVETSVSRAMFSKSMRQEFRMAAAHIEHVPSIFVMRYETHHILPLAFGGDNKPENLALVESELHIALHAFIRGQTADMVAGDRREIDIPYLQGLLWPKPELH